jgi:hypothetical protein
LRIIVSWSRFSARLSNFSFKIVSLFGSEARCSKKEMIPYRAIAKKVLIINFESVEFYVVVLIEICMISEGK